MPVQTKKTPPKIQNTKIPTSSLSSRNFHSPAEICHHVHARKCHGNDGRLCMLKGFT